MRKSLGMILIVAALATMPRFLPSNVAVSGQTIRAERVEVTVPITYSQDRGVLLGSEPMNVEVLQQRLRQMAAPKNVILHVARSLAVGDVMDLMDGLKASGAEQVAITN